LLCEDPTVRVSAKVDYAVRAMAELAAAQEGSVKGDRVAKAQRIPLKFLENILAEQRRAGLVSSQRGAEGGYWLARTPAQISIADVIRAVEGPLADVHGTPPEKLRLTGAAKPLKDVWVATRASLRAVLEEVTLANVVSGDLPPVVDEMVKTRGAWSRR
jgi:Rrf2 family protein